MKSKEILFLVLFSLLYIDCFAKDRIAISSSSEAECIAVANSKSNRLRELSLQYSKKSSELSFGGFLPSVDFNFNESDSIKTQAYDTHSKTIAISLRQLIFDGGKTKLTYDLNKATSFYELKEFEQELNSYKLEISNQYFECLLLLKKIEIEENLERNAELELQIIKTEYELGEVLENDYLKYFINVKKIKDQTKQTNRDYKKALTKLKISLGYSKDVDFFLESEAINENDFPRYLEEKLEKLWNVCQRNNLSIKKNRMSLYYSQKQDEFSKRYFLPQIYFEGGIHFSGTDYPLTQPSYSAKIKVDFLNNTLIPVSFSNGYEIKDKKVCGVNNSVDFSVKGQPQYFSDKKKNELNLRYSRVQFGENLNVLYEKLYEKTADYDDLIDNLERLKETEQLEERNLLVSRESVNRGEINRLDYLEELEEHAKTLTEILQSKIKLKNLIREIEIFINVQSGGLRECIL
ncbi:TolC family protein [Treponema pectinovorum]|uniref:TolC family protein n=1 Tax=Treponema pectinovorum TaxID=164 RepID=UPI0011C7C69E|nr:TolC family protein [Treponema pectinovorum]